MFCTTSGAKWCDTTSRSKFLLLLLISDGSSYWKNFLLLIQEKLFSMRRRNKGDIHHSRWSVTSKSWKFLSVFRVKDDLSVCEREVKRELFKQERWFSLSFVHGLKYYTKGRSLSPLIYQTKPPDLEVCLRNKGSHLFLYSWISACCLKPFNHPRIHS